MSSSSVRLAALVAVVCGALRGLAQPAPSLGSAASFAVLGGSGVTNTGSTTVAGNVGVSSGDTISGFPSDTPDPGDLHRDDALARAAQRDAAAAFANLGSRPCTNIPLLTGVLEPGVYCAPSSLIGTLTLDARGNADAAWIFQLTAAFTTDAGSSVVVINGGREGHVFWRVDGSAALGAGSAFIGSLFARTNITLGAAARVSGRLLALTGTVTLNTNRVTICCSPMTLSPSVLPDGTTGTKYNATITIAGGTASTVVRVGGELPPGLTLSTNGVLSGTPSGCGGTYRFTAAAADAFGCPAATEYSISIACTTATGIVLSDTLPAAKAGLPYSAAVRAIGGTPPYVFALTCGSLPPGLTLTPGGVISGVPATKGTFSFALTATDTTGAFGTRCYVMTIDSCPVITIAPASLPDTIPGTFYRETITASGGSGSYAFSTSPADLPPGLVLLETGVLSGTVMKAGCYSFTVIVLDLPTGCFVAKTYRICVTCGPVVTIVPPGIPDGIVGTPYSMDFSVSGGGGPYEFSARPEDLPDGLSLLPNGVLSGTPAKEGCYTFEVIALDAATGCFVIATYTVCFTCPEITVLPATLPTGVAGSQYTSTTLTATGGTPDYKFTRLAGTLPPDLTLLPDGRLVGDLTASGVYRFTVMAVDSYGCSGTRDYTVVINEDLAPPLTGDAPVLSPGGMVALTILLACAAFAAMRRSGV